MRFLKGVLPNLTIALNLVLLIVIYLDLRNPMMGFLVGTPFLVLACACCLCSVSSAVVLYADWRKKRRKKSADEIENKNFSNSP